LTTKDLRLKEGLTRKKKSVGIGTGVRCDHDRFSKKFSRSEDARNLGVDVNQSESESKGGGNFVRREKF